MTTSILTSEAADVKRTSLRCDLERINEAILHIEAARAWLRGTDDTDELRVALTGTLEDAYAVRRVYEAELTTLEVQP